MRTVVVVRLLWLVSCLAFAQGAGEWPASTPLRETQCSQDGTVCLLAFAFEDEDAVQSVFTGSLRLFLNTTASRISQPTHYEIFFNATAAALCSAGCLAGSVGSDLSSSAVATDAASVVFHLGSVELDANTVFVTASNEVGRAPVVPIVLEDLVPSVGLTSDLTGELTREWVRSLTVEKLDMFDAFAAGTIARLQFNYFDSFRMEFAFQHPGDAWDVSWEWFVDSRPMSDSDFVEDVAFRGELAVGPFALDSRNFDGVDLWVVLHASAPAQHLVAEPTVSSVLKFTVLDTAQEPDNALPSQLQFTDDDLLAGTIGGTLWVWESHDPTYPRYANHLAPGTFADPRLFDFFVVYGTNDLVCGDPTDDVLAVHRLDATASVLEPHAVSIRARTPFTQYIGVVTAESTGLGGAVHSAGCVVVAVEDAKPFSAPPPPASVAVEDLDGAPNQLRGVVEIALDPAADYSDVEVFEVYQAVGNDMADLSADPVVTVQYVPGQLEYSAWLGTFGVTAAASAQDDPGVSLALFDGQVLRSYLVVLSRTADAPDEDIGTTISETGASVLVVDRRDDYFVIDSIASHSGFINSSLYYPFAEASLGGQLHIGWVAMRLDGAFEVSSTPYSQYRAFLSQLSVFYYRVRLFGEGGEGECELAPVADWPATAPRDNVARDKAATTVGFDLRTDFDALRSCGFVQSGSALELSGRISLELRSVGNRTDAAGSSTAPNAPQIAVEATVEVVFDEVTHAATLAEIDNVRVVDGVDDSVASTSSVRFYTAGFVAVDTEVTGTAGESSLYVQHQLDVNADVFFVVLQRVWFAGDDGPSASLYDVEPESTAFENVDTVPVAGRFRFVLEVPFVINCQPCFLHVQSVISTSSQKDQAASQLVSTSALVSIGLPEDTLPEVGAVSLFSDAATHAAVHALVVCAALGLALCVAG